MKLKVSIILTAISYLLYVLFRAPVEDRDQYEKGNKMTERYHSGAGWFNRELKTGKHPQYSGTIHVEGVEYFIDTWVKDSTKYAGEKFLSFSVKRKEKQEVLKQMQSN